ncbi:hypothetical protein ABIC89_002655 [Variovorax boronicumulans]|uniref:hypothetical protein n=1 Tax=Variovorax boronicumulans TaxID=436515 RepID=UPI0033997718
MGLPYFACLCNIKHLARSPKQGWTRLLPRMCLYHCANCGKSQLFLQQAADEALARNTGLSKLPKN